VTPVAPSADEISSREDHDPIWEVKIPLSSEELATLPSPFFLKEMGEALTRELGSAAFAAFRANGEQPSRRDIDGNVTPILGPIKHIGDLHIHGSVHKGSRVKATGSITVDGGVETAFLDAGDHITIEEGLLGTARSAMGSIRCGFAQGANMEALQGAVEVTEAAMHCQIYARHAVTIGDILLGGSCYGEDLVQVRIAGSESGVPTHLYSGRNRHLLEQIERIRQRALRHIERLAECDAIPADMREREEGGIMLAPEDRSRLWRAIIRKGRLNADLRQLSQQKSALLGMINKERGSRVCVSDRVYPGVKVGIDDTALEVRKLTQYVTFSKDYDLGELRMTPYH
jgi:hypothetical protein